MPKPQLTKEPLPEQLLSIKDVMQVLQYSYPTVKYLIKTKQLKARRVGWKWRIRRSDLEDFIEGNNDDSTDTDS